MKNNDIKFAYFGTDQFSVSILQELKAEGLLPELIITNPNRPKGRKLLMTPPPVKIWADENNIKTLQPENIDADFISELKKQEWDLFVITSYGKIIPNEVIDLPKYKTLNVHPSLLPLYRGASPVESAILDDAKETGVTIMKIDEKMDHGPILNQEFIYFDKWPDKDEVYKTLADIGGKLLAITMRQWVQGKLEEQEQDHENATYTKMFKKEDGEIDPTDDSYKNYLKYIAFNPWPGIFFFKDGKRMKVTKASLKDNKFKIEKVVPEGKSEIDYTDL